MKPRSTTVSGRMGPLALGIDDDVADDGGDDSSPRVAP